MEINAPWGFHSVINLRDCDPLLIRDKKAIEEYVHSLCRLIDMKCFGECYIQHFGDHNDKVAGYSMFQFIETSNICAHFANQSNDAYIDIFSCRNYDHLAACEFSAKFFKSQTYESTFLLR